MAHRGIVITAGFNRSKSALALAERFKARSVPVKGLIVVSPYSLKRLTKTLRKRGFSYIKEAIPRLTGRAKASPASGTDYLQDFLTEYSIPNCSLSQWTKENNADFLNVTTLNGPEVVQYLKDCNPSWLIYSGGGIIKPEAINAVEGRILNAHQGPLPAVRGMNACEWAMLLNHPQEVTIHLIDQGIDTGKIITARPFSIQKEDDIEALRSKAKVEGIKGLIEVGSKETLDDYSLRPNHSNHRQCYILSPELKQLLKEKIVFRKE
jgi:folate-dependent phosphoribosylglycinamide formyltransferase PurN